MLTRLDPSAAVSATRRASPPLSVRSVPIERQDSPARPLRDSASRAWTCSSIIRPICRSQSGSVEIAEERGRVADLHGARSRRCSCRRCARPAPRAAAARRRTPDKAESSASGSETRGCASCTSAARARRRNRPARQTSAPARRGESAPDAAWLSSRNGTSTGMIVIAGQREQFLQLMLVGRRVPRRNGAVAQRLVRVGHDQIHVDADDVAKAFALGTRPQRTVEADTAAAPASDTRSRNPRTPTAC